MTKTISYSLLLDTLNKLYQKIQRDGYDEYFLIALEDTQKALLILELLNLAYSDKTT